jgi:hypothetical protein
MPGSRSCRLRGTSRGGDDEERGASVPRLPAVANSHIWCSIVAEQNGLSGGLSVMSTDGRTTLLAAAVLMLGLSLCSSAAPAGESSVGTYPRVHDLPPAREKPALTVNEQSKLKEELINARDRQTSQVKARDGAAQPKSKKP